MLYMVNQEIKKYITIVKDKKKVINITIFVLFVISIICYGIYKNNVDINYNYDSNTRYYLHAKDKAEKNVNDKREIKNKYGNQIFKTDKEKVTQSLRKNYENANNEYIMALKEAKDASEKYLETFSYHYEETDIYLIITIITVLVAICLLIFELYTISMEITIDENRIYGKKGFGQEFSMLIKDVSLVSTSFLKGVTIRTSAGKVNLICLKKYTEIYTLINDCLNKTE